jgi:YbbR domain-containing protein
MIDDRPGFPSGAAILHFLTETLGWRFLFALVLSIALWSRLTLEQNPERRDLYPTEIPVEAGSMPNGLVVANDIQPVRLRISAPSQSWRTLEPVSFRAKVDLADISPGLVQRDVQVEVSDPEVKVLEVMPARVSVRVEELRNVTVPVRVNQLGSVPFGYRISGEPSLTPPTVQISGPSSAVERVTEAAVTVRLDDVKSTVDQSLKPEPRGPTGAISGVRIEPQLVTVTLRVEQIAGSKTVSVVPEVRGQPATGYWQGRIAVEPAAVQVVAEPSLLEQITVINTAPVDIAGADADVVRAVALQRPTGVTVVGEQNATVRVSIQALQGQQVRDAAVTLQGVPEGRPASASPAVVQVTLSGPQPVLARLQVQDIVATANADGLGEGTAGVLVAVRVPDGITVDRVVPERVTITVAPAAPPATPQPAPTAVPEPSPTLPPAATATPTASATVPPAATATATSTTTTPAGATSPPSSSAPAVQAPPTAATVPP